MPIPQSQNIKLDELSITNVATGKTVDIKNLFREVLIYEDVFSAVLSATVTVEAAIDIDDFLPFTGQDIMRIRFASAQQPGGSSSSRPDTIDIKLVIVKKGDSKNSNMVAQTYTLHCVSAEAIQNEKIKINRRFDGEFTETIKEVYGTLGSSKPLVIDDKDVTKFKDKVLVPNWKPFKAINFFANRSVSNSSGVSGANYLFFERIATGNASSEFVYTALSTLVQKSPTKTFYRKAMQESGEDSVYDRDNVISYSLKSNLDHLNDMTVGTVANETLTVDITRKRYNRYKNSFFEDAKSPSNKTLESSNSKSGTNIAETEEDIAPDANIVLVPKRSGLYAEKGKDETMTEESSHVEETAWRRMSFMNRIEKTKCLIRVPGDTSTRLADVVEWKMPKTTAPSPGNMFAEYLENRWLVTAIVHKVVSGGGYTQHIELVKDSFSETLPKIEFEKIIKEKISTNGGISSAGVEPGQRRGSSGSGGSGGSGGGSGPVVVRPGGNNNPGQTDPPPVLTSSSSSSSA